MKKGYNNSAFGADDCCGGAAGPGQTSLELERVVISGKAVAKCCNGDPSVQNNNATTAAGNVCLPKCPAVRPSPWDPVKTRFAAALTVSIVIWLLLGAFVVKF